MHPGMQAGPTPSLPHDVPGPCQAPLSAAGRLALLAGVLCLLLAPLLACSKKDPTFEDVPPADQLYSKGMKQLQGRKILGLVPWTNYSKAIETFQQIVDNYPYSEYEVEAQLRIADAYFEDGRYDEALSYYRDFGDLHPQHPKVPYTILRSALCKYKQTEATYRDQTETREAIQYLETLLRRFPYSEEGRQGEVLYYELRTRLAKSVMDIGDFYLDREQYQSAANRYRDVLDEYPGLGLDGEALFKLGLCYEHLKRVDEAVRLYHVVLENFRQTPLATKAAERIAAAN